MARKRLSASDKILKRDIKRANERVRQLVINDYDILPVYQNLQMKAIRDKTHFKSLDNKYLMPQFRTDVTNMSEKEKKEIESMLKSFLNTKTSTTKGARDYLKKIAKQASSHLTFDDIIYLFKDSRIRKIIESDIFSSDEIIDYANNLYEERHYNITRIREIIATKSREEIESIIMGETEYSDDEFTSASNDYMSLFE